MKISSYFLFLSFALPLRQMWWVGRVWHKCESGVSANSGVLANFSLGRTEHVGRGLKSKSQWGTKFHLPQNWQILKYYPFIKCLYNKGMHCDIYEHQHVHFWMVLYFDK